MATSDVSLKVLIEEAVQKNNEDVVARLLDKVETTTKCIHNVRVRQNAGPEDINLAKQYQAELDEAKEGFVQLFQLWLEDIAESEDKAKLALILAENTILDTPEFRSALQFAVRKFLPPYLANGSVVKAIGAKEASVSVRDVALRLKKLQHLRSTALMFHQETKQWSKINGFDKMTGTIAISSLQSNSASSISIANAVTSAYFFNTTPDFINLLYPSSRALIPSAEYRRLLKQNSLTDISDQKIKDIVFGFMVPAYQTVEAFEAWWGADTGIKAATSVERSFVDARSILELHKYLPAEHVPTLNETDAAKLAKLFQHIRREMPAKDISNLIECIAAIADSGTDSNLLQMIFAPLRGKAIFWPTEINEKTPLACLEAWGHLSVKLLPGFVKATAILYSKQEMVAFATRLPLRCIPAILDPIRKEDARQNENTVIESLLKVKQLSADLILWIWKNQKNIPDRLKDEVDTAHVLNAISAEGLPREWTASQRDLKRALFEKPDFQKFIINNANGDIPSIISAIQRCRSFQGGERQSLLVKMGGQSEELKTYIEAGSGRLMMGSVAQTAEEAPVTSLASHRRLAAELENLISIQIPENAAAVALARSFGDLRENAEYDAAKEKRRFLHRRRAELEKTLGFIRSTDFKDVVVEGHVVVGSFVRLASASGDTREYYVLGAWDGDPEKNRISYKTKIGEVLLNKKVGEQVIIPEAGSYTVKEILPLPEALRKELAAE